MKNFLKKENLEKIIHKNEELKHIVVEFEENRIFFAGDFRQLMIFQLIRNEIVSNFEDVELIGSHKVKVKNVVMTWDENRTNLTTITIN